MYFLPSGREPSLLFGPVSQTVREGEPLQLTCAFLGLPTPRIRWNVNDVFPEVYFDSPNISIAEVDAELHAGNYYCQGTSGGLRANSPVAVVRITCKCSCLQH